tara:strand:+ start:419 stop:1243 length:825 start_codon:yes stop_codon:yes gene_type:complete
MINKNYKIKKLTEPYPYLIIDNFFSDSFYSELEQNFPNSNNFSDNNVGRMHGDMTFGENLYDELLRKSKAYYELHHWVYSKNFINFFINIFRSDINNQEDLIDNPKEFDIITRPIEVGKVFNIDNFQKNQSKPFLYSRLDLGYGKKNYGVDTGGRGPHIDNPQRLISILMYIGGFNYIKGGEHRIYKKKSDNLLVFETIQPIKNRIIASLQNNDAFHDVNPVVDIDGQRNAFYLAISASKKIWKSCKRNKININYNKNRVEKSLLKRFLKKLKN